MLTEAALDETARRTSSKSTVTVMATACGLSAANLIYAQPLLAVMGRSFAVSVDQVGLILMLGLLGYALGLILIVPLGEQFNRSDALCRCTAPRSNGRGTDGRLAHHWQFSRRLDKHHPRIDYSICCSPGSIERTWTRCRDRAVWSARRYTIGDDSQRLRRRTPGLANNVLDCSSNDGCLSRSTAFPVA